MCKMETKNSTVLLDFYFEIFNRKKRKKFKKENANIQGNPIVFFGDSITDRCDLEKFYPGKNAINRGISGNTVTDLINRIDVSVCGAHPSKVILLVGINDMMNVKKTPQETAECYEMLLMRLINKCGNIPIICQSIYPGYDAAKNKKNKGMIFPLGGLAQNIVDLNGQIREMCKKYECTYVDVHSELRLENNTMRPTYSDDGCHPNESGYRVVSKCLMKYL